MVETLHGPAVSGYRPALRSHHNRCWLFSLLCGLLVIIWIDLEHQIIPDVISLPGILLGFIFSFVSPALNWQDSLIGLLLGGGVLYAIALFYYLWKKQEGMGGGDIKLLAMIGAFLGWQALPFVIFASSLSGSFIGILAMIKQGKGGKSRIPFGPFLALAALPISFFQNRSTCFTSFISMAPLLTTTDIKKIRLP